MIIVTILLSWLKLFTLFLLLPNISKLVLTTIEMVKSTLAFGFIILCFFIISGTVFSIKFREIDEENYGTILIAMRRLLDYMVTNGFENEVDHTKYFYIHTALFVIFVLITNMFFLNTLIALITSVYKEMLETGEYK